MDINPYLILVLVILIGEYFVNLALARLNLKALNPTLPAEFVGLYDADSYQRSQTYTSVTTRFSTLQSSCFVPLTIAFILLGGFNLLDQWARQLTDYPILVGVLFIGAFTLLLSLLSLPFSLYSTFVIEERFGFNKTSYKTFLLDLVKSLVLSILIGGPLLAFILWFFTVGGEWAWLYCWGTMVLFTLIFQFIAPVLIMPLFNRFTPLETGELSQAIHTYAQQQGFAMQGIYTMDGSKRSTRLNAFFTGLGRFRRIVFFDTLIEKLDTEEIVAVLAHEMGHFKLKHLFKMMIASTLQLGLLFYILSLFLDNPGLFAAFGMEEISVHAGLLFFGFLYAPISALVGVIFNFFSRQYEYQADTYAVDTVQSPDALITGLKKLCLANLANLTPHPWHVFLHYSHPPIVQRIAAIRQQVTQS